MTDSFDIYQGSTGPERGNRFYTARDEFHKDRQSRTPMEKAIDDLRKVLNDFLPTDDDRKENIIRTFGGMETLIHLNKNLFVATVLYLQDYGFKDQIIHDDIFDYISRFFPDFNQAETTKKFELKTNVYRYILLIATYCDLGICQEYIDLINGKSRQKPRKIEKPRVFETPKPKIAGTRGNIN